MAPRKRDSQVTLVTWEGKADGKVVAPSPYLRRACSVVGRQGEGVPTIILRDVVGHEERKIARGELQVRGVTQNSHLQTDSSQELLMHILNCKRVLSSGQAVCSF